MLIHINNVVNYTFNTVDKKYVLRFNDTSGSCNASPYCGEG